MLEMRVLSWIWYGCLLVIVRADDNSQPYYPARIRYEDMILGEDDDLPEPVLLKALHEVGIVAVSHIPYFTKTVQRALGYTTFHQCAVFASHASNSSQFTSELNLGSVVRHTIATHDYPSYIEGHSGGMEPVEFRDEAQKPCEEFVEASRELRDMVRKAVRIFGLRLGSELEHTAHVAVPLLTTSNAVMANVVEMFRGVADVVMHGHHLEHFHSYQARKSQEMLLDSNFDQNTLDMHTDQGLFIAFVPGRIVRPSDKETTVPPVSKGLYITLANGTLVEPIFESDDLVFMLGDGVNHLINPLLPGNSKKYTLRPVPHLLSLELKDDTARTWYGRMVLPPPGAYSQVHASTYNQIRSQLLGASSGLETAFEQQEPYSLGCASLPSSNPQEHIQLRRLVLDPACSPDTPLFCWDRCMHTIDDCPQQTICAKPDGTPWDGQSHDSAFGPYCKRDNSPPRLRISHVA